MKKRIVSMCLAVLMTVGLLPLEVTAAWAAETRQLTASSAQTAAYSAASGGPGARNLEELERAAYDKLYREIYSIAKGTWNYTVIDCGYTLTEAQRERVWDALRTDTTWERYWISGLGNPTSHDQMNMWYFNVKSEYRANSNDIYHTNINYVVGVPGGPDRGADSGTDYEKLLTNIKTAQNSMPNFPGTTAAKLQYLGSVTKWNGEVEIYKGGYNWNVVNLHGRRYIVDASTSNCVLRGTKSASSYSIDGDYAKVYSREQMTIMREDYSPYPGTIALNRATADRSGITVTWQTDPVAETYRVYRRDLPFGYWKILTSSATGGQYLDTSVEPDTTYYYTVEGVNGEYVSLSKNETGVSAATASAAPADVTLTAATPGDGCIKVTWQAAAGAVTYNVYRKGPGDTSWKALAYKQNGTSYQDTGIKGGAKYSYTVRGVARDGQTLSKSWDQSGVSTTAPTEPATVKLLSAAASGSGIVVKWKAALNAATYNIYRKGPGDTSWRPVAYKYSGTSYTDKNVTPGAKYSYTVRGVASNGTVLSKSWDNAGVSTTMPPVNVTLTKAAASGAGITVTWQKAAGAATYNIYRKAPSDTNWRPVAYKYNGTSYVDKNVEPGTKYSYTVRGVASDGKTLSSGFNSTGVSTVMLPADVTLSGAAVSGTSIVVTWQAAAGAATYNVYRKGPGDTSWKPVGYFVNGTSYMDTKVTPGARYIYTVRGVASDNRALSKGFNGAGVGNTVPKAPETVTLSGARYSGSTIVVTWKTAAGAATYNVYRKGPGDTSWRPVVYKYSGTSYTDKNVVVGARYRYTVRGVAADGKSISAKYNGTGVSATLPPANVTLTSAAASGAGITVTWQKAAGAVTYNIYRKGPSDTSWRPVVYKYNGTSYVDKNVEPGTKYSYTVRGVASDGKTLSSGFNSTGVSAVMFPADVKGLKTSVDSSGITFTWEEAAGAASYNVYRKTTKNANWVLIAGKYSGTSYKDTDIADGVLYSYTVRGVASDGKTLSRSFDTVSATASYTGTCGQNVKWSLNVASGALVFTVVNGNSCVMDDYSAASPAPWYEHRQLIKSVSFDIFSEPYYSTPLYIGANAFADCVNLTSVQLSAGLTGLGSGAFSGCASLKDVYYDDDLCAWQQIPGSADELPAGAKLTVKDGLYESGVTYYTSWELTTAGQLNIEGSGDMHDFSEGARTTDWYPYRDMVKVIDVTGVSSIGANAFRDCRNLDRVSISADVTAVGDHAFANCTALSKIIYGGNGAAWTAATAGADTGIPSTTIIQYLDDVYDSGTCGDSLNWLLDADGILTISGTGPMADYSQRKADDGSTWVSTAPWAAHTAHIRRIVLEEGVTSVGNSSFMGCTEMTDITLPASVTKLGRCAFEDCASLTSITLPESLTTISNSLFEGCTSLTGVTLPTGVTSIEFSAFEGCASLTEMTIPAGVTSIGFSAFSGCTSLTEIVIPDSVTELGGAFSGCTSLASVRLPSGLTTLGSYMFSRCPALTAVDLPEGITAIGDGAFSSCTALASIRIPAAVQTIGASAFSSCSALTTVDLPEGLTAIADNTFSSCDALTSVRIPAAVKTIGDSAFWNCDALTAIDLPEGLTDIGRRAFFGCDALTSVRIPAAVKTIGDSAFDSCEALTSVQAVCSAAIGKEAFSDCKALTEVSLTGSKISLESGVFSGCTSLEKLSITGAGSSVGDAAMQYCRSLTTADLSGVVSVDAGAFAGCTSLTSVQLPNASSIGDRAFYGCDALAEVTFPTGSTTIGASAFQDCSALTEARITAYSLTLGDSAFCNSGLQWISITGKITAIEPWTFARCPLRVMCVPNGVTSIGYRAFYNCKQLCSIYIPDSVKSIDDYAFIMDGNRYDRLRVFYGNDRYNWNTLTANHTSGMLKNASVTYGYGTLSADGINGAGSCGPYEMGEYDKVQWTYTVDGTLTIRGSGPMNDFRRMSGSSNSEWYTRPWTVYMPAVRSVVIEEGVTSVGSCAFCEDSGQLTAVQLPESLTSIGQGAFGNCTALRSVSIPKNVTAIGDSAFSGCTSLTSIAIPEGVTAIGGFTFSSCTSLGTVKLPATLTTIGGYAFYGCKQLNSADLPAALTSIGSGAFSKCALKSVSISDTVTSIGGSAFSGCASLASVTLGSSLTEIPAEAFYNCTALTSITIPEGVTTIGESAFAGCTSLASVVIPDSVTSIGENAFSGCTALATVKLGGGLTSIEAGLFDGCPITDLTISEGVTTIGERAFAGGKFQKLTLPDSITTIGPSAFEGCADMTSVKFGSSLTTIEDRAFANCKLYSVKLPDSVRTLGTYAFGACAYMTVVSLNSVTTIGECAFRGCNRLNYADIPKTVTSLGAGAFAYTEALLRVDADNPNYVSEDRAVWSKDKTVLVDGRMITENNYVIPSTVTTIEAYAFANNRELLTLKIPASVTTIGAYAFVYCRKLTTVTNLSKVRRFEEGVFSNCFNLSSISTGDVHYFGTKAFNSCSKLKTVSTRSLQEMGDSVFYKCTSLQEISIPNTVKSIGEKAFTDCTALTRVGIHGATLIKQYAFFGCTALQYVYMPASMQTIKYGAFYGCSALTRVFYKGSYTQWKGIRIEAENDVLKDESKIVYNANNSY